jgi:hypothetical protein
VKQASSVRRLGNLLRTPAVAGFIMFGLGLGTVLIVAQPAQAQLPAVNMGRFVHQPGDNQYSSGTQDERHGPANGYQFGAPQPQQVQGMQGGQGSGGYRPIHKMKPDISLEPIVCDEPIPKAGFPPIPDSLELPFIKGGGSFSGFSGSGGGGGGGSYGGGGGGSAPGMGMPPPTNHQGYGTYQPGYFQKGKTTGKGAEMYSSGDGAAKPSGGGGGGAPPASSTMKQLNRMGAEPTLSAKASADAAPEAPQAVQINQSTTQDLSLPDDQNQNGQKKKSQNQAGRAVKRMQQQMTNRMGSMLYSMPVQMPRIP